MYILLLDGLFPKFVTCTSEAAFAGGAPDVTAISSPAAVSVATQAASSALSHLFMPCPVPSLGTSHPFGSSRSNTARSRNCFEISRLCFPVITPLGHLDGQRDAVAICRALRASINVPLRRMVRAGRMDSRAELPRGWGEAGPDGNFNSPFRKLSDFARCGASQRPPHRR